MNESRLPLLLSVTASLPGIASSLVVNSKAIPVRRHYMGRFIDYAWGTAG